LYNPSLQRTIDIVYDCHRPEKSLSTDDFQQLLVEEIKPQLYKSESFLLGVFEKLNSSNQASNTAIVAESSGDDVSFRNAFLGFLNRLVSRRMRNITYIDADTVRRLLITKKEMRMPNLPKPSIHAWHDLYNRSFGYYKNKGKLTTADIELIEEGSIESHIDFHRLADVEMLWHILNLRHKRIIVYCGAFHGSNIRQFLMKHAGYQEIYGYKTHVDISSPTAYFEMPLSALQPLTNVGSQQIKQSGGRKIPGQLRGRLTRKR
jgi:hypothetical protein